MSATPEPGRFDPLRGLRSWRDMATDRLRADTCGAKNFVRALLTRDGNPCRVRFMARRRDRKIAR